MPATTPAREIRFEAVGFTYPGADRPALRDLDLAIPAGRSLAIVGENGAGKTSLVKLLCGLYDPTAGRVTVDGADLSGVDPVGWRSRVAVLFQDFARYQLPVADNVGLGAPELAGDRDRLRAAAGRAGASVLVLDEPTAALDVRAEAELYERFLELTEGLTTVLISHRFSTVRRAERIVVLAGGAVVEEGTHQSLLAAGGEMFTLQAARFVEGSQAHE